MCISTVVQATSRPLLLMRLPPITSQPHLFYSSRSTNRPAAVSTGPLSSAFRRLTAPTTAATTKRTLHDNLAAIQIKKRPPKKKQQPHDETKNTLNVIAYSTAEEYNLEALLRALHEQELYEQKMCFSMEPTGTDQDVLYVTAKYQVQDGEREIFFFREGSVVFWNCTELEAINVLQFLRQFETDRYTPALIEGESELMSFTHTEQDRPAQLRNGVFQITNGPENYLEKYTFSNALSTSIKLGIWEASLDQYVQSMAFVTDDLKRGAKIKISRAEMLRKTGELFALRHLINLSSDLLDTPDFYWDREELETLYSQTCTYFSIARRTKVMNEKLNHCVELADLISSNLNDIHHVRLEWMIIVLIMVEVGFEVLHYMGH